MTIDESAAQAKEIFSNLYDELAKYHSSVFEVIGTQQNSIDFKFGISHFVIIATPNYSTGRVYFKTYYRTQLSALPEKHLPDLDFNKSVKGGNWHWTNTKSFSGMGDYLNELKVNHNVITQ